MPKPQRFCIFCGGTPLSREHIWANWLRGHVPRDMTSYTQSFLTHTETDVRGSRKKVSGDPRGRKLRVVCRPCNNNWMSQLQERSKDVLLPLIEGKNTKLRKTHQELLASWATMFTMVAEQLNPERAVIPKEDRFAFKNSEKPLTNWKIWIGKYNRGNWPGHFVHNILPVYLEEDVAHTPPELLTKSNTQESTFVVGKLLFYTFSSTLPHVTSTWTPDPTREYLFQIWPSEQAIARWPLPALDDELADIVANRFWNRFAGPRLKSG
jgi:hypothetical protein